MKFALGLVLAVALPGMASATIVGVSGPNSTLGTAAAIIAAPADALDDIVTNTGMEGFDEAQGVVLGSAVLIDGGGSIAAGTRVDSHMIFLNTEGNTRASHREVVWTFSGRILGIMSDSGGNLEAASTPQLGAPGTNYTVTFGGSGPAAPFPARGLEASGIDGYSIVDPFSLLVTMEVTEPGDWIRVVTEAAVVPVPASVPLLLTGIGALGFAARKRRKTA